MEIQELNSNSFNKIVEDIVGNIESINLNKDEIKSNIINSIYKKYDLNNPNLFFNDVCQFFFEKIGYSNLNLPIETEMRIKAYLHKKINDEKINYNDSFNILINEFYKSEDYHVFLDNFNKRVNRSFLLHNYKNKNDVYGFLNFCTIDELVTILR
jgi:hypothetical protein